LRFRHALVVSVLTLFSWPEHLVAQDACSGVSFDAFSTARKARRIVSDYERLHSVHAHDMGRLKLLYSSQTGAEKPWSFGVAGLVDWEQQFGFEACSNLGPWTATLNPWTLGSIGSLEINSIGLGFEVFGLWVFDRLEASPTEAQTRTDDGGFRDPVGLASVRSDESMVGARLTFRDWATLVGGWIQSEPLQRVVGEDGRELIVGSQEVLPDRIYLGAGVPRFNLYSHVIFDERDVQLDHAKIGIQGFPIFVHALTASAALGYIGDEEQVVLGLGVGNILGHFSADISLEHDSPRLRHARVRAEVDKSWGFEPDDLRAIEPGLEAYPRFAFDVGAFADLSYFQSQYLSEQRGLDGLWGTSFGAYVRPDITIFVNQIDFYFGVNTPERIERMSEGADHWYLGVRLYSRLGL